MSEDDDMTGIDAPGMDALERLDRALDRIEAKAAHRPELTDVAARLDAMIARLGAELEG